MNCQNDKSCGHFKDRDKNRQPAVADDLRFIKPTDAGCHRYFRYSKYGDIVPSRKLENEADHQKAKFTIEVLGLQCYRLVRDRKSILTKFYKIYESVKKQKVALDSYLADEFPDCGDDFAFWSARNQHRKLLEQAPEEE